MTRQQKASLLIKWFNDLVFETYEVREEFFKIIRSSIDILCTFDTNSNEWVKAYMDLYNFKQEIVKEWAGIR